MKLKKDQKLCSAPVPLDPSEADRIAALIRRCFAAMPSVQPPPSALRVTGADIAAHVAAGGGGATIPDMRACLLWAVSRDTLTLSRLAVAPEYRGRGLARLLLAEADRVASVRGLTRLTLSTRLALDGNRRLFAAAGFAEGERHAHPGHSEPTFVTLEKSLRNAPARCTTVIDNQLR